MRMLTENQDIRMFGKKRKFLKGCPMFPFPYSSTLRPQARHLDAGLSLPVTNDHRAFPM